MVSIININKYFEKTILLLMALIVGLLLATIEVDKIVINSRGEKVVVKANKAKKTPKDTPNPSPTIVPSANVIAK